MAGNKRWSGEDLAILKKEYGITPITELAEKLGRTIDAVHWKASKTGVKFQPDDLIDIRERLIRIELKLDEILTWKIKSKK